MIRIIKPIFLAILIMLIKQYDLFGQTEVAGVINSDSIWTISDSPISITGDIGVNSGVSLSIESGVVVNYLGDYEILILGSINMLGAEGDSILFEGNAVEGSKYMLNLRRANFSSSSMSYVRFSGPQKSINIDTNEEFYNNQSYGELNLSNTRFVNSEINAVGNYYITRTMVIEDSKFENTSVSPLWGLTINNSQMENSSFGMGCTISNSQASTCHFEGGVSIMSSRVSSSTFDPLTLKISGSILQNVDFLTFGFWELTNSIIVNSPSNTLKARKVDITNSLIAGSSEIGVEIEPDPFNGLGGQIVANKSTFVGFDKSVTVEGEVGFFWDCNFISASTYLEAKNSACRLESVRTYYELNEGEVLEDKIIDSSDNLNFGTFTVYEDSDNFTFKAPAFPNGDLETLASMGQIFVSRVEYNPTCLDAELAVSVQADTGFNDNQFILQMSDINQSFVNPIHLDTLDDTSNEFRTLIPDTIVFGESYLIRVYSTQLDLFTTPFEVKIYENPEAEFTISSQSLCFGDTCQINYTGNADNTASYLWDFSDATIVSGTTNDQGPFEVFWGTSGDMEISLEVIENGCSSGSLLKTIEVKPEITSDFLVSNMTCEDDTAIFEYTGTAPLEANYNWNFDNGEIIQYSDTLIKANWTTFGTKNIHLSLEYEGCESSLTSSSVSYIKIPTAEFQITDQSCSDDLVTITYKGNATTESTFNWDFDGGELLSSIPGEEYKIGSWPSSGVKKISLQVETSGCSSLPYNSDFTVLPPLVAPSICLVSVDSETSSNYISWAPTNPGVQVMVYRESNATDVYELIGLVDDGMFSHTDTLSTPSQRANRYKISSIDSCGVESDLSDFHKTIHLSINKGLQNSWNLIWDNYVGFDFSSYQIFRGHSPDSMYLIAELPSNLNSYSDFETPDQEVYYQVGAVVTTPCSGNQNSRIENIETTVSNIADNSTLLSTDLQESVINIFPNPTNGPFQITSALKGDGNYFVYDLSGRLIETGKLNKRVLIELNDVINGTYLISIMHDNNIFTKKITISR